jgi:hypothetical protein
MAELNKGYSSSLCRVIPKELRAKYPKGGITVSLSDHTSEVYTPPPPPPPPPYTAFSGQAVSFGGAKPVVTTEKPKANVKFPVDESKKKTSIQIRFHNGDKQTIEVNLDTRVQAIFDYVRKVSGLAKFDLVSGFPPTPLKMERTVTEMGLEDSTIIQKA